MKVLLSFTDLCRKSNWKVFGARGAVPALEKDSDLINSTFIKEDISSLHKSDFGSAEHIGVNLESTQALCTAFLAG